METPRAPQQPVSRVDRASVHLEQPASASSSSLPFAALSALFVFFSLPFRIVFWTMAWLGRMTISAVGFVFVVFGIVLWAGHFSVLGILLVLVGLVLMLRWLR
jgi:hypothetical protein